MKPAKWIPPRWMKDDFTAWERGLTLDERTKPDPKVVQREASTVDRLAHPERGAAGLAPAMEE